MERAGAFWGIRHLATSKERPRRTMHSKVRSGCGTCKRRKLKCDEGKPECERCVKSGIQCLGYGPPKVKTQQTIHPSPRSLVTLRPKNVQRRIVQTDRVLPTPQLTRSLSPIHLNSSDVGYFDMFRHYILRDIKVWCRGLGFDAYLIQEFMREESVRAAILGLTAMSKATQLSYEQLTGKKKIMTARELTSGEHISRLKIDRHHHHEALKHYTKAIYLCRQRALTINSNDSIRPLITSTLMFVILEVLQGNMDASSKLLLSALGLLKAETRRHKPTRYTLNSNLTDDEERTARLEDIFYHLYVKCPQYIWTHSREDLCDRIQPNEIPTLPTNDLPVALLCINWERTMRLVKRFSMSLCPETPIFEYEGEQCRYIAHIRQWKPLLKRMLRTQDIRSRLELRAIEVEVLIALIYLECCLDPTDRLWDTKKTQYREIIIVLEKLVNDMEIISDHVKFMFDFWLIPPLTIIITQCRNYETRQKVLNLLVQVVSHSATWISIVLVKCLQAIIDIEELGRDDLGMIPPAFKYDWISSRWNFEQYNVNIGLRSMTARFTESPSAVKYISIQF
ncbi:hypothetical protein N5P37_004317 [Trichoderma harzianum]|uniref:Zn(2)-C6 fungal-type domain-containing protein n=1 Tax=Trichoderma harzianum CBS 226.95 TaxID=983964 RepID=A0A2T4AMZ4_TRIHA|nr:hypothetical protein M431DRAFT_13025 [Trichoderma harzianum CBS 226.95]KAK0763330.1 hypothetical protein N5P37_004317 [Trichoderma harzianum]PTB58454.1 hypothetical protein M431DRAFT_13025 [Trichoderma harzianum CBS 226.95]